jgi:acyl-coenzyme A synthetase/AMP-(fatty) acid ligase
VSLLIGTTVIRNNNEQQPPGTMMADTSVSYSASATRGSSFEAPDGPALIGWLANDARVRTREISDGCHTVAYADTPPLLEEIDRHFARCRVTTERPIALECSQSVAGALMLLHALSRQYNVVVLPDLRERSKEEGSPRFIPSFCSHVVSTAADKMASRGFSPENCIECAANEAYAPDSVVASLTGPDLYLRTSGSTGNPKLARMSHQKWLNNAAACIERWKLTADDRFSVPVPIFHSYGFGAAFLPGLLAGAAMDLPAQGNIVSYVAREACFNPNIAFLTPAMCDTFLARRPRPRAHRLVVTAGDRVKRDTVAGFEPRFGPLLNLYGSAEMGAVSTSSPDDPFDERCGTAGYPLGGIELRTANMESDNDVTTVDGAGILQCRQANGFAGYLIQEQGWRFEPRADDAWFDMLDLAKIRRDGYVEILGRSGLSAKRDGLLVVFADVEAALEKADGVQRAVVVAAGESLRGSRLIGVCLTDPTRHAPQPEALRRTCQERLPRYAVPDEVIVVDSLPQLPSGKIDRRTLREWIVAGGKDCA